MVIQGFGNAGMHAASIWSKAGHTILAVSDSKGGTWNENGLNVEELITYKKEKDTLAGFPNGTDVTNGELLEAYCDLLIPAAFENQITDTNASKIKAKVILELANGPTTPAADDILASMDIHVIPDVLANSGGVTVSTFEWEQNLKGEHWSEKEVFDKLEPLLAEASKEILTIAKESKTDLRRGAFILALERIKAKMSI